MERKQEKCKGCGSEVPVPVVGPLTSLLSECAICLEPTCADCIDKHGPQCYQRWTEKTNLSSTS